MNRLSEEDKKLILGTLNALINLAKSDDEVHGHELLYLLHLGRSFGVSEETVRDMLAHPKEVFPTPDDEANRMTMLYHLLFMMKMDGQINEQEKKMVIHYGFLLGFNEIMVLEMIESMQNHLHNLLPENELINIVKKHLN